MADIPMPAQQVFTKLRDEISAGPKPSQPLGSTDRTQLTRLATGQRPITEDNARKLMAAVWDAGYFQGKDGPARLKRLGEFIRSLPESSVPSPVPGHGAKARREAWVNWFARLGAAAALGGSGPIAWPGLVHYLDRLRRHLGELTEANVRLLGGTAGELPRLEEVFVSLDAHPDWREEPEESIGRGDFSGKASKRLERVPAIRHLAEHPRLVLLGPPGSGKSTLLKYVCECLAAHAVNSETGWLERLSVKPDEDGDEQEDDDAGASPFEWPAALSRQVPVFIELRAWIDRLLRANERPVGDAALGSLMSAVEAQLSTLGAGSHFQELRRAMEAGCALICLDGLDEVPTEDLKRWVRETVERLAKANGPMGRNRIVVTCRTVSYRDKSWQLEGFEARQLCELTPVQIRRFVRQFYNELKVRRGLETASKTQDLLQAIQSRPELGAMASNPYLLTLMAQLHLRRTLPSRRAELFEEFVRELLVEMEAQKRRDTVLSGASRGTVDTLPGLLQEVGRDMNGLRGVLSQLAWQAHRSGRAGSAGSLSAEELLAALAAMPKERDFGKAFRKTWAQRVIAVIEHRTGLLVGQGGGSYTMAFKLQEYMTALHFTDRDVHPRIDDALASLIEDGSGYWEEVVRLAAAHQARTVHLAVAREIVDALRGSVMKLKPAQWEAAARRLVVASDIVREIGLEEVTRNTSGETCVESLRQATSRWSADATRAVSLRAQVAMARGWLGQLPEGIGTRTVGEQRLLLPDLEWSGNGWAEEIPPSPFLMGSKDGEGHGYERPQFQCRLLRQPFRISRYPVTVAQFEAFRKAGGYEDSQWWTDEAWRWVQQEKITGPRGFDLSFQTPNHPQVGVSFHEVTAFARWLNAHRHHLGVAQNWEIRLPTEVEWERAARGTDGGEYPWSRRAAVSGAPYNHSHIIGHTSAVDLFPEGRAACGAAEMAGNVLEWTVTERANDYTKYPRDQADQRDWDRWVRMNRPSGVAVRVVRGGAWYLYHDVCRAASRDRLLPEARFLYLGFRLAASPISGLWSL